MTQRACILILVAVFLAGPAFARQQWASEKTLLEARQKQEQRKLRQKQKDERQTLKDRQKLLDLELKELGSQ